jgi:hypothetical protein
MSCNEWERGELTLPAAEFARVRQAVQAADDGHKKRVFAKTQKFWEDLTRKEKADSEAYLAAVARLAQERNDSVRPRGLFSLSVRQIREQQQDQAARETAIDLLYLKGHGARPARVLQAEMHFPTNRTTTFRTPDCSVSFDAATRMATWDVPEGNHACERACGSHLAEAFFGAIEMVRWTHGTGGVITGNDEYARDSREAGGGANYVKAAYGYRGIQQAPMYAKPFTNAKGQQVTVKVKMGRSGPEGEAVISGPRTPRPAGYGQGQVQRAGPAGGHPISRRARPPGRRKGSRPTGD